DLHPFEAGFAPGVVLKERSSHRTAACVSSADQDDSHAHRSHAHARFPDDVIGAWTHFHGASAIPSNDVENSRHQTLQSYDEKDDTAHRLRQAPGPPADPPPRSQPGPRQERTHP